MVRPPSSGWFQMLFLGRGGRTMVRPFYVAFQIMETIFTIYYHLSIN
jgi:hypothetical protein